MRQLLPLPLDRSLLLLPRKIYLPAVLPKQRGLAAAPLIKGHTQFDFIKSFRHLSMAGITWGDLINLVLPVERGVAKALTCEQPVPRKSEGEGSGPTREY